MENGTNLLEEIPMEEIPVENEPNLLEGWPIPVIVMSIGNCTGEAALC